MSTEKKVHGFVMAMGGLIKTPCGIYTPATNVEGDSSKVTCENCKRTHEHAKQEWTASWQRVAYGGG